LLATLLILAGCASGPKPAATTSSTAATPATAPSPVPQQSAPPSPETQRAFDDARRALAAGRTDEAARGFKALAQAHPELGGPHANLGLIHRQAGRDAEAVAELERAVQASPQQPQYLNQLGIAYRQQGAFDKARGAYERALEADPNYAAATLNLGILHDLYLGDGQRALELYERYLAQAADKDPQVGKWIADLKNRKPPAQRVASGKKEQP